MNVKMPCGRLLPVPDELLETLPPGLSKEGAIHILKEDICLGRCEYSSTCGYSHDWFVRGHRPSGGACPPPVREASS